MSFVFRGSRADIETGFPGFIPERRTVVFSSRLLILSCVIPLLAYLSLSIYEDLTYFIALRQRVHAARPVNTNSLAFLVTGT